jgi:hypothetical protein
MGGRQSVPQGYISGRFETNDRDWRLTCCKGAGCEMRAMYADPTAFANLSRIRLFFTCHAGCIPFHIWSWEVVLALSVLLFRHFLDRDAIRKRAASCSLALGSW